MSRYFLTGVQIEGFRGINNEGDPLPLTFEANAVNSVFAPNAQGKSSIFEALCYVIKGIVPKLEAMPAADRPEEYYTNRFHTSKTATVLAIFSPDDGGPAVQVRVQRLANGTRRVYSPSGYGNPEGLLKSLNTEVCLVDHRTFLSFVEDSPLKRGRSFSGLLGIGKLSEFRQALEILANSGTLARDFELSELAEQRSRARQQIAHASNRIKASYLQITNVNLEGELNINEIAMEAARILAEVDLLKPFLSEGDVRKVDWESVRVAIRRAEQRDKQARLGELVRAIATLEGLAPDPEERNSLERFESTVAEREAALSRTRGPQFKELYELILQIVESQEWDNPNACPGCESDVGRPLASQLRNRLTEYLDVIEKSRQISVLWKTNPWVSRLRRLVMSPHIPEAQRKFQEFSALDSRLNQGEGTAQDTQLAKRLLAEHDAARECTLEALKNEQEQLRKELPPSLVALTEQVGYAEQLKESTNMYEASSTTYQSMEVALEVRQKWAEFIQKAAETFSRAEVQLSTKKTSALEAEYQSLYQDITKNPDIVPALQKSTGGEELHLLLKNFYGLRDLSASTLLAESYRNTLAIAIFLSALVHDRSPSRFIVLDDVTSSFDAGHQFALMEVIRTRIARPLNPNGPQVVMLSHDGLLEKYFDRISSEASWHHQRIQGLPPKGAILAQVQDADRHRSRAEQFLQAGQVQPAEPLVRQYLEFQLQQIIRKVNIRVPFDFAIRDDKKQVQTCLDAINCAIDLNQAAGRLILSPAQVSALQGSHIPALVGNWIAHYATGITASLSPYVLLSVLDTIDKLADCFKYDCRCAGSVQRRYYRDVTSKQCGC